MKSEIDILLDKYFAGETTSDEEKTIRRYFAENELSDEMREIAPIFTFLEDEAAALVVLDEVRVETTTPAKRKSMRAVLWTIAVVAASLFIGIILVNRIERNNSALSGNYAWVNGKRITDMETVKKYAELSFEKVKTEENILEEQLSFMFE